MDDLAFASALEQAELIRTKQVSPVELVSGYLNRIEKIDPEVNAFVTVVAEDALAAAAKATDALGSGDLPPFHGVPIAIKDLADTAGIRTTYSCKAYAENVPAQDAAVVRRIREAGFIILGKTNTPEFGTIPFTESELNGQCRNPWDTTRNSGGSSGGAAAAIAAGLIPVAHGTDGGGSIRVPSSCCGLFGIKPARGRVSHGPKYGDTWAGATTDGPIARHVRDAAALLDVMAGYEVGDPYWAPDNPRPFVAEADTDPGRLRIAFTMESPNYAPVDPSVVAATEDVAQLLASLGHEVELATPDWVRPEFTDSFIKIVQTNPLYYGAPPDDQMEPINRELLDVARRTSSVDYLKAVMTLQRLSRDLIPFWDDYDVLLTPTLALPPVPLGWIFEEEDVWACLARSALFIPFTPAANVSGQPAVNVPLNWSEDGVPIGAQLMGRPADEATLIRLAAQLETARPWADRRAPTS